MHDSRVVIIASAAFGLLCIVAAVAPGYAPFAVVLIFVGASSLTMMNTANAYVQTTTAPMMRGRVMALYMAIFVGGTPLGAPIVGWVANEFGPRWAMGIGASSGILAAIIAGIWMLRSHRHRMAADLTATDPAETRELATQEIAIVAATARRTS